MKAYQPTRTHLAIVVCIVVVQAMLLTSIIFEPKNNTLNNDLVVIDPANTLEAV